ncbi:phage neck terminator protein [Acinetobacter sp. HY1485]|uniref:phage neck terminator protein n=1 Tax=Acinetobacter sp. HY1485 TaxID=2970918 RepID=UPI0022B9A7FD|nr:hypothetical protein [Acinetobacter sp. HY1485]
MATSATGGFLSPSGAVTYGQELEDLFQAFIVGVTGLDGTLVRPRWQPEPLPMPSITENWCAFGIKTITPDDGPYFEQHNTNIDNIRHEVLEVFLSFYGLQGQQLANTFKNGLGIPQNIQQLLSFKFVDVSAITTAPDFLNQQYVHRYDLVATFRRKTTQQYAVDTLQSSQIKFNRG